MDSYNVSPGPMVVIIGAGFAGVITAISLKENLGFHNFVIFEKGPDVGGTWNENIYPGCFADVPIHYYSLSTDLKADWDNTCEPQPKILNYVKGVIQTHKIGPHIRLNTEVIHAKWDSGLQAYKVTTEDKIAGTRSTLTAQIVISANGMLHVPKMPVIPGLDTFKGTVVHTAKWDKSLDLRGKRVAVIGNGSTGAQIMVELPKIEGIRVTHFYRTKNWHLPGLGLPMPKFLKWVLMNVPFATRLHRWLVFWVFESTYYPIFKYTSTRATMMKLASFFVRSNAPEKYHDILIPDFPLGTRRNVFDSGQNGYLQTLHLPNVDLRYKAIAEVYPEGIITPEGEKLPFDVVICATGYVTGRFPIDIKGAKTNVQAYYDSTGGPNAYMGCAVPGFPNLCLVFGPNSASGYTSILFFLESQVQYITKLIKPVLDGVVSSFEVTAEANAEYNNRLQKGVQHGVWNLAQSWYRVDGNGRNCVIFPWSCLTFWWWCQRVNWSHYRMDGLKGDIGRPSKKPSSSIAIAAGLALAVLYAALQLVR